MPYYDPTTGHTTSPTAHAMEDDDTEARYSVTCDGVCYEIISYDAEQAERRARSQFYRLNLRQPKRIVTRYLGVRA